MSFSEKVRRRPSHRTSISSARSKGKIPLTVLIQGDAAAIFQSFSFINYSAKIWFDFRRQREFERSLQIGPKGHIWILVLKMAEIVFVDSKVDFGCTKIHKKKTFSNILPWKYGEIERKGLPWLPTFPICWVTFLFDVSIEFISKLYEIKGVEN